MNWSLDTLFDKGLETYVCNQLIVNEPSCCMFSGLCQKVCIETDTNCGLIHIMNWSLDILFDKGLEHMYVII